MYVGVRTHHEITRKNDERDRAKHGTQVRICRPANQGTDRLSFSEAYQDLTRSGG